MISVGQEAVINCPQRKKAICCDEIDGGEKRNKMREIYVETTTFKDIQIYKYASIYWYDSAKIMEPLLTLFVLDDVLVLLVHDGATEAVLGPGKESW